MHEQHERRTRTSWCKTGFILLLFPVLQNLQRSVYEIIWLEDDAKRTDEISLLLYYSSSKLVPLSRNRSFSQQSAPKDLNRQQAEQNKEAANFRPFSSFLFARPLYHCLPKFLFIEAPLRAQGPLDSVRLIASPTSSCPPCPLMTRCTTGR